MQLDLQELEATRVYYVDNRDCSGLLDLLAEIRTVLSELKLLERDVEDSAVTLMDRKIVQTNRITAEKRKATDRKSWQHADLARKVMKEAKQMNYSFDHPDDVANLLLSVAGISYWRVGELRTLGIDPDEYCESTPGRTTIQLRERDHA